MICNRAHCTINAIIVLLHACASRRIMHSYIIIIIVYNSELNSYNRFTCKAICDHDIIILHGHYFHISPLSTCCVPTQQFHVVIFLYYTFFILFYFIFFVFPRTHSSRRSVTTDNELTLVGNPNPEPIIITPEPTRTVIINSPRGPKTSFPFVSSFGEKRALVAI